MTKSREAIKRVLSVYDGQDCVGTIKVAGDGEARAFDQCGKRVGKFQSVKEASHALTKATDRSQRANG
jgi:hypothetical protein